MVGHEVEMTVLQALGKAQDLNKAGTLVAQLESEFEGVRERLIAEQATLAQAARTDDAHGSEGSHE